jgi:hypothetical protein
MPVTRRSFLSGATSVLTTVIALGQFTPARGQDKPKPDARSGQPLPFKAEQNPVYFFRAETFRPYVGGVFTARAGKNSIKMTLVRVRDCAPKSTTKITTGKAPQTDCFALEFTADESLTDLTTIYDIEHAALGEFPLFMTRREGHDGKTLYEAVFNHLR